MLCCILGIFFKRAKTTISLLLFMLEVNMFRKNIILLGIAGLFLGVLCIGQRIQVTPTNDITLNKVSISQNQPHSGQQMSEDRCAACHGFDETAKGLAVPFFKAPPPRRLNDRVFHLFDEFQEVKTLLMPRQLRPARISHFSRRSTPKPAALIGKAEPSTQVSDGPKR